MYYLIYFFGKIIFSLLYDDILIILRFRIALDNQLGKKKKNKIGRYTNVIIVSGCRGFEFSNYK